MVNQPALDATANPYSPGAGVQPPLLAGRDAELTEASRLLARARLGYVDQPRLAVGVRGVGKTVLLLAIRDRARTAGAFAVHGQARSQGGVLASLIRDLDFELRRQGPLRGRGARAAQALAAVAVTIGGVSISVTAPKSRPPSDDLAVSLYELLAAVSDLAGARDGCLVIILDELQQLEGGQLSALLVALQRAAGDNLPVVTVAAGLPGVLARAAAVESFAERMFVPWVLDPLDAEAAELAVREPALHAGGVEWSDGGLRAVLRAANGYPFYLQHYAAATWDAARGSPISMADARLGVVKGNARVRDGVVAARFQRLSRRERDYVIALARLGPGAHTSGAVAARLETTSAHVGSARRRLVDAGVVHSPGYGQIAFTLPLFERFVLELAEV